MKETHLHHGPLILVIDIDGALTRGAQSDCARLHRMLQDRRCLALIYVTSRTIEGARTYQEAKGLPRPDVFVAEGGSSVAQGRRQAPIVYVDRELDRRWPGARAVRRDLEVLGAYMDELTNTGERHLAYLPPEGMSPRDFADVMATALQNLGVDVVQTEDGTIDVVPDNVTSGFTVDRILEWMEADPQWVVVASSNLRHADLFRPGRRGIVVASADAGLKTRTAQRPEVYTAEQDGAAGVLEGLRHFGYVTEMAPTVDDADLARGESTRG